jgi:predicted ATPase
LFTDVEGSTRRWEADAEAMRAALVTHDEVLRAAVAAHNGFLFKHTGDGVCAAFGSPAAAVDAATEAQRTLQLPVRMGIATGEAELRDDDYFGAVLNRAARVMTAGHGGQILVAESTAGLLSNVDLIDLGPRRLRDLPNPIQLFQVRGPGLRTEFPALRALDPDSGNLRVQPTSFIGREVEAAGVRAAIGAHRLVTLTGVGGVGKTRLAVEVAGQLTADFPDGIWIIELASVIDSSAVPDAVAAALGVTHQPGKSIGESIAGAMEGRVRLLVFDNCEHVLDVVADLLQTILDRAPSIKVVATSREGLGVADEHLWPVPSLDVDAGADSPAVILFVKRAQAVSPQFSIAHADDAHAAVEICRRLDGIPLAIELAASRISSMTTVEVRDRLDQRFRLLVGTRRSLARHQTLRQTVQWSYDLLTENEQLLLERCSVFAGGFDLQSACAVSGSNDSDDYRVLDCLDALVRKSLVVTDQSTGRTRFSMLETIRQFAEERLAARGLVAEARDAHARHFGGRETDILTLWDGPHQREAYAWFAIELANLRSAFRWAADQGDLDTAATLAIYATSLGTWVQQYEPVAWAEELLEPARVSKHRRLPQLYVVAAQCHAIGRVDDAVEYLEAGREVAKSGGFDRVLPEMETSTGVVYSHAGRPERWVDSCRKAIATESGALIVTRACLAMALYFLGDVDGAQLASAELVAEAHCTDNPMRACFALIAYGLVHHDVDPSGSHAALHRAVMIARDSGNRQMESAAAVTSCIVASADRDPSGFFGNLAEGIRYYDDAGSVTNLRNPIAIVATTMDRLGHHEQAAVLCGFADSDWTRAAYPPIIATVSHLREVLGDQRYEKSARAGKTMPMAEIVVYAYNQIDRARGELT